MSEVEIESLLDLSNTVALWLTQKAIWNIEVPMSKLLVIRILIAVIAVAVGLVANLATNHLPESFTPYLWLSWPLLIILILVMIALTWIDHQTQAHASAPLTNKELGSLPEKVAVPKKFHTNTHEDWSDAPIADVFYGREMELQILKRWLTDKKCRLGGIFGIGGQGKTALCAKVAYSVRKNFDYVIWRSLINALPPTKFFQDLFLFISNQESLFTSEEVEKQLSLLFDRLSRTRCLIVIDNFESVFDPQSGTGKFREGFEAYGKFILRASTSNHKSCILLTSREVPREFTLAGNSPSSSTKALILEGLDLVSIRRLLADTGISGSEEDWRKLIEAYSGSPLALKIAGSNIRSLFGGKIDRFLKKNLLVYGDIYEILRQQFERISYIEMSILFWLCIERETCSLEELEDNIVEAVPIRSLIDGLNSLQKRSLIEQREVGFSLQNVIMEYITERLVRAFFDDLLHDDHSIFENYALMKADSKDYIRDSQVLLIAKPLISQLLINHNYDEIEQILFHKLDLIRETKQKKRGYTAGNILNLLIVMKRDLTGMDFTNVHILQAHLCQTSLRNVHFTNSHIEKVSFKDVFGPVLSVALNSDSRLLAAGTYTFDIRIWNVITRQQIYTLSGHSDWVRSIKFSDDGSMLASSSDDKTARIWYLQQQGRHKVYVGHSDRVLAVAFLQQDKYLATGSEDKTVKIWDVGTGKCTRTFEGHSSGVWSISVLSKELVASAGKDGIIFIWNINTGNADLSINAHEEATWCICGKEQQLLASGGADNKIRLWNSETGSLLKTLEGHSSGIWGLDIDTSTAILVSGSEDHTIKLWSLNTGECLRTIRAHDSRVRSVTFNNSGKMIASGSEDQTVRLWDTENGQCIATFTGYTNPIWTVALNTNGEKVAAGSEDAIIRIWETRNGELFRTLQGHEGRIWSVAFCEDSNIIASGSNDTTIRIWDIGTGKYKNVLTGHVFSVKCVKFSPSGLVLASASEDKTIRLWDVATGKLLKTLEGHAGWVRDIAFCNDSILASCSDDLTIKIWDIENYKLIHSMSGHEGWIYSIAIHPKGTILASGSADGTVRLWDCKKAVQLKVLHESSERIRSVEFSTNGTTLAVGSDNGTISLYNIKTGKCLRILKGHRSWVRALDFSPNNDFLVSGSYDGTVRLWNLSGENLRILQSERPYEGLDITHVSGLTAAQRETLKELGAWESQ